MSDDRYVGYESVDVTMLLLPAIIGVLAGYYTFQLIASVIGYTITYGGNLCAGGGDVVADTCGIPPVGLIPAIIVGLFVAVGFHELQQRTIERWLV